MIKVLQLSLSVSLEQDHHFALPTSLNRITFLHLPLAPTRIMVLKLQSAPERIMVLQFPLAPHRITVLQLYRISFLFFYHLYLFMICTDPPNFTRSPSSLITFSWSLYRSILFHERLEKHTNSYTCHSFQSWSCTPSAVSHHKHKHRTRVNCLDCHANEILLQGIQGNNKNKKSFKLSSNQNPYHY